MKPSLLTIIANRARTSVRLIAFFLTPDRFLLAPLLLILLLAGILLIVGGGLSQVAPFVYTLF
jgi:hypothetical protein